MAPSETEISIAMTFIETVMITLPIWLAGIRYFLHDFEEEEGEDSMFPETILLVYVALAGVLVSSGVVITDIGNKKLSSSVYLLWILFFSTGAITFKLLERRTSGKWVNVLLWFGIISGVIFFILSFAILVRSNL